LQYIYNISNIFGCCFIILYTLFLFLFETSVLFIFQIDLLATRKTIIVFFFCLFSVFLLILESYTLNWIVLLSWFYLVLVSIPQELKKDETRGKA
jgi:hypothetical protein